MRASAPQQVHALIVPSLIMIGSNGGVNVLAGARPKPAASLSTTMSFHNDVLPDSLIVLSKLVVSDVGRNSQAYSTYSALSRVLALC